VLAASQELRTRIGERGRANVEQFAADRLTNDLERVYRETVRARDRH
jgi:hypothetical protein